MNPNILIKNTQEQDDEEFIKLIDTCKEKLYRIAFAYLKNEQNSLDAVSQSIYKAYMNMNELKTPKFFNTWIIRILINTCNLILNHDNKVISIEDYNEINNINETLDTEFKIDSNIDLYNSIDKLSERFKSIVILKYLEDMTISQVSEILDLPEGTVKVYLRRALKILKTELG
ncbi:sigma-70 family RNA polymerase sigma factor [Clostridium sp.]|uniref:sigma-70 family RNA polymerase sigma factor n=1 Tax=Clostridium sp. TaxID=1506 RepID=UPI003D6CD982